MSLLPFDTNELIFKPCCVEIVFIGCILAATKLGTRDYPFYQTSRPDEILTVIQKRVTGGDPACGKVVHGY